MGVVQLLVVSNQTIVRLQTTAMYLQNIISTIQLKWWNSQSVSKDLSGLLLHRIRWQQRKKWWVLFVYLFWSICFFIWSICDLISSNSFFIWSILWPYLVEQFFYLINFVTLFGRTVFLFDQFCDLIWANYFLNWKCIFSWTKILSFCG